MRTLLRIVAWTLAVLVVAAGALYGVAYWRSEQALAHRYALADAGLAVTGTRKQLERGRHVAVTRGCTDCHGADLGGGVVIDAPPIGRIVASNLTPGGVGRLYDARTFEHAIRHAVAFDGTPLVFMPAEDYAGLSDADTAALIAYLLTIAPIENQPPELEIGPLARVLWLFDRFPLLPAEKLDHDVASVTAPEPGISVEYGAYLAQSCAGCHGADFAGGLQVAPDTPRTANLTPHAQGLAGWTEADFFTAMRDGKRPDGTAIDLFMPWRSMGQLTDAELKALWAFLQSLPAKPDGNS
jgi:cytochrome c553